MEEKKNSKVDINRYRSMFFNGGLVLSLALVLMAFEWKTPNVTSGVDFEKRPLEWDEILESPITKFEPPPKPIVPVVEEFIEKPDDVEINKVADLFDPLADPGTIIEDPIFSDPPKEEVVETVHTIVESMPKFNGGDQAMFLKYVSEKLKYPNQARRMGIEGKVFVQFVIDKDGSMSEIQVVKGIGAGCDEEVLRVMNDAPKWEPGKQRGIPVKVRMIVPVRFTLN